MAHRARKSAGSTTTNGFLRVAVPKGLLLTHGLALVGASAGSNGGQLYAGMYPDDFWRNAEILNSVATWAGKPMTFGGTFVDAEDDVGNIDVKLEQTGTAPVGGDRDGWLREMFAVLTADSTAGDHGAPVAADQLVPTRAVAQEPRVLASVACMWKGAIGCRDRTIPRRS